MKKEKTKEVITNIIKVILQNKKKALKILEEKRYNVLEEQIRQGWEEDTFSNKP